MYPLRNEIRIETFCAVRFSNEVVVVMECVYGIGISEKRRLKRIRKQSHLVLAKKTLIALWFIVDYMFEVFSCFYFVFYDCQSYRKLFFD